jgi:zinc transport system substrate-binding protein
MTLRLVPAIAGAAPNVVVSLKPVELLVRAVATDDTTVTTLVGPGSNPHNYSLRPSQRQALSSADAVFWIGPEMETFLTGLLEGEEFRSRSHAFMASDEKKQDDHHHHGADDHGHGGEDPHIWLDPATSLDMVRNIHSVLKTLPGADLEALNANLSEFERSLLDTEKEINRRLEPARALSLFTYHNAFTHFAEHYRLPLAGVLTLNPELSPGARHIADVQDRIGKATRPCLMTERPFNPDSWAPITGEIKVSFSDWDPLATDIRADSNGYIAFQISVAEAVLACL